MKNFDWQNSISKQIMSKKDYFDSIGIKIFRYAIYFFAVTSIFVNFLILFGILESSIIFKLGWVIIAIAIIVLFLEMFLKNKYFKVENHVSLEEALKANLNLADYLDENSAQIMKDAYSQAEKIKYLKINPIIILNSIQSSEEGRYIFSRIGAIKPEEFQEIILNEIKGLPTGKGTIEFDETATKSIFDAANHAASSGREKISIGDIVVGIMKNDKAFQAIIFKLKLKPEDIEDVIGWYHQIKEKIQKVPFWKEKSFGVSFAEEWAYGYTTILSQFAYDMTEAYERYGEVHVYGREKELIGMERILSKNSENNVILIGDKGIGKNSLVQGLVAKIEKKEAMPALQNFHVFKLDTGAVLSGATEEGEIHARLSMIFNDAVKAGNIILYIEDFHNLVSSGKEIGQVNASEVLLPYLRGAMRIIATTNNKNYHDDVEANPGISQLFEKINVSEPDKKATISILEEVTPYIEMRSKVFFTYQDLKEIIRVSERYIADKPFPQKAIDLVDEVAVKSSQSGVGVIDAKMIDDIASEKTSIPVSEPEGGEKEKLMHLEEFLHKRIIDQEEAISVISNAMRRARSGLAPENRPVGAFLFLGPTGVGKTETAKALSEAYFGSDKNMIRLDMSEFQEESSVNRLLGTQPAPGKAGTKGELSNQVKDKPFSLVLLDEMEKANPKILTLFLQVFDEGYLGSAGGEKINFKNTIIICTSNAGSEFIRENLNKSVKGEELKRKLLEELQSKRIFSPEFLNRFDAVVAFHPLSEEQISQVAKLMLTDLSKRMKEKDISLEFTQKAITKLAKIGFDPVYGARPMRRTIQEKVEDSLAKRLLSGEIKRGEKVVLDEKDI